MQDPGSIPGRTAKVQRVQLLVPHSSSTCIRSIVEVFFFFFAQTLDLTDEHRNLSPRMSIDNHRFVVYAYTNVGNTS